MCHLVSVSTSARQLDGCQGLIRSWKWQGRDVIGWRLEGDLRLRLCPTFHLSERHHRRSFRLSSAFGQSVESGGIKWSQGELHRESLATALELSLP